MNTAENLRTTAEYLPQRVRQAVMQLAAGRVLPQEIRLRSGRPVSVTIGGRDRFLTPSGMLTDAPEKGIAVTPSELGASFHAVCAYSVHSHVQDVAEGFVTIRGGCRVGICGTAVTQPDGQAAQRQITSLNFRIAGEAAGTAQGVWTRIGSRPAGILIAGAAGSGKTTFLRDLCRIMGNICRTALVDERGELACMHKGLPQHDVGALTDVLDGWGRAEGVLTALRVLTPVCIVCDEISTRADADALLQAAGCGVHLAASCHAGSPDELYSRPVLRPLLEAGVFRYAVFLEGMGHVRAVRPLTSA